MEVGLEMQDRPWQHMNGENSRASYHSLPPIAALTTCRPTSVRKDDHVFSIPNPPKPAGLPAPTPRAPTPFPETPQLASTSGAFDQSVRTSPGALAPSGSQAVAASSERIHQQLSVVTNAEVNSSQVEQRQLSSPNVFQNRALPLSEPVGYMSPKAAEGSRSSTPYVPVSSPVRTPLSGNDIGRNTPLGLSYASNEHKVNVSLGNIPLNNPHPLNSPHAESPRSFTPKHSPAPSPSPRTPGDRGNFSPAHHSPALSPSQRIPAERSNILPTAHSAGNYSPAVSSSYPVHSSPLPIHSRSYTPTSAPHTSSAPSYSTGRNSALHLGSSPEAAHRYTQAPLQDLRLSSYPPTSHHDLTSQYKPHTAVSNAMPHPTNPGVPHSNYDQFRPKYPDRSARFPSQPPVGDNLRNFSRQNERIAGYFPGTDPFRMKAPSAVTAPQTSYPSSVPQKVSEVSNEYSTFPSGLPARPCFPPRRRHISQHTPHSTSAPSQPSPIRSQIQHPSTQAVPFFRTDTSSMVWTTPAATVTSGVRPQDSAYRQFAGDKVNAYQGMIPSETTVKTTQSHQPSHVSAPFRQGIPLNSSHQVGYAPSSREHHPTQNYPSNYQQQASQKPTGSTASLPRINPPLVVNVTSTFTPRFTSTSNQNSASYHQGATRVPPSAHADDIRSSTNHPFVLSKHSASPIQNTGPSSALPRVNFPSPSATSFDSNSSLPGSNAFAPRSSSMVSAASATMVHQQYNAPRTSNASVPPAREMKQIPVPSTQGRYNAYSQVQSHAAFPPHSSNIPSSTSLAIVPPSSTKYPPTHRQFPRNIMSPNRPPEALVNSGRYPPVGEAGARLGPPQFAPSRNSALETDTCRNPFELPPPSNYGRTHQGSSVIKSHSQSQRGIEINPATRPTAYPYAQPRADASNRSSEVSQAPQYAVLTSRNEPMRVNTSEERPNPPTVSARFPPVPQMHYDLQRQICDRMKAHQTPPRTVEKPREDSDRRNPLKVTNEEPHSQVSTSNIPPRHKRESPLDLSVKTVRQSADSTRDDVDLYVAKHFSPDARMASAPKVDFTPNFAGPLVHPEPRNNPSLPPVQTIRSFQAPPTEASSPIQPRKRPMPEPEPTPPPKIPKVDAWKLAIDEQIEERLKAARMSRAQPTPPLVPVLPHLSNPPYSHDQLRQRSVMQAHGPPIRPSTDPSLYRHTQHDQMIQQMKIGRESLDMASKKVRDWNLSLNKGPPRVEEGFIGEKAPAPFVPDSRRLVQQISQGVIADTRLLHDKQVVDLVRTSLEEKEARLQQLQNAARKKPKLPPYDSMSLEVMCVPPSYKHTVPQSADTVKIGIEPTRNYLRPTDSERPQEGADFDGLAAFLAARIRTKAEMKQMGSDFFRAPEQGGRPSLTVANPPKLPREGRLLTSPQRRRSDETIVAPPRDPAGLRSSSETSVFDFRESDSEGEMPVLERQTLEGMRRDRKIYPRSVVPSASEPEPGPAPKEVQEPEPDPAWDNACDMFVEQLQKRPVKRSVRKKKPNPKFFANEAEAPEFLKMKTEDVEIKIEPVISADTSKEEVPKPKNPPLVKKEVEESEKEAMPLPAPLSSEVKEEELSSSSEELQAKAVKETKKKTLNKRQRSIPSESEWESSSESNSSNRSSAESSENASSSSENESEEETEPKGRRVQTRQQARSNRPATQMKLRSKRRGGADKDAFHPGWEEELYKFKQQLRMPERLINISKPKRRGPSSLPDLDSETESKNSKSGKKSKKGDSKKDDKSAKKEEKGKKKSKKEEKYKSKSKSKDRPSSAPPLTRRNLLGIVTRGKEKILRNGASAAVRRSNKAVQNSKRHLNKGKKKLKLRRKFRSGFDYMRRKKKQTSKKDGDTVTVPPPESKRRERSEIVDISAEVKSWVVNKGAGETVLHRAARLGYAEVAEYCLETLNVSPSPRDHAGYTPLHEACSRGHLAVAKFLLQYGANVSESARGGVRPLHQAAENNYIELIRLLLAYGADPLLMTYAGHTALSLATHDDVKELITQHLADVRGEDAPKWSFEGPSTVFADPEWAVDPLASPPSPEPETSEVEIEGSSRVLPPLYRLPDDDANDRWMLVTDLVNFSRSCSAEALLSRLPNSVTKEITDDDFRERATSCNMLTAPKPPGPRIQLIRYDEAVRQLMEVELVTVSIQSDE